MMMSVTQKAHKQCSDPVSIELAGVGHGSAKSPFPTTLLLGEETPAQRKGEESFIAQPGKSILRSRSTCGGMMGALYMLNIFFAV